MLLLSGSATGLITCCKLDSTLCIETSQELRTRLAEVVYEEHADQSLTKQLVTCSMDTAYPPIRNTFKPCFSSWLGHGHQVYFNPKDTLLFSDLSTLRSFLPAVTREDGQQVRFIALNPTFFSFPQNGLFSSMTAVNYADCILQSAFVLMNVLETLGNVEEITFLVPEFSDEDILDISSAITILRTGLEAVVAFSPDPAQ
jgi:hypothetical protein